MSRRLVCFALWIGSACAGPAEVPEEFLGPDPARLEFSAPDLDANTGIATVFLSYRLFTEYDGCPQLSNDFVNSRGLVAEGNVRPNSPLVSLKLPTDQAVYIKAVQFEMGPNESRSCTWALRFAPNPGSAYVFRARGRHPECSVEFGEVSDDGVTLTRDESVVFWSRGRMFNDLCPTFRQELCRLTRNCD